MYQVLENENKTKLWNQDYFSFFQEYSYILDFQVNDLLYLTVAFENKAKL